MPQFWVTRGCLVKGARVYLSSSNKPKRKTKYTWEMILINKTWAGINATLTNTLFIEAIKNGIIPSLSGFVIMKREFEIYKSRIDILAEKGGYKYLIEVKNVTLKHGKHAMFPDTVTKRGLKHLNTLITTTTHGFRAIMLYVVQRTDTLVLAPAYHTDPVYSSKLFEAYSSGVEIIALQADVSPTGINIIREIPFELEPDLIPR